MPCHAFGFWRNFLLWWHYLRRKKTLSPRARWAPHFASIVAFSHTIFRCLGEHGAEARGLQKGSSSIREVPAPLALWLPWASEHPVIGCDWLRHHESSQTNVFGFWGQTRFIVSFPSHPSSSHKHVGTDGGHCDACKARTIGRGSSSRGLESQQLSPWI